MYVNTLSMKKNVFKYYNPLILMVVVLSVILVVANNKAKGVNNSTIAEKLTRKSEIPTSRIGERSSDHFDCQSGFFQIASDKFLKYITDHESYEPVGAGATVGSKTNSYGFNTIDEYIYGLDQNENLIRLNKDGTSTNLGSITGLPDRGNSADFDETGILYCVGGKSSTMYKVDITTRSVLGTIDLKLDGNNFTSTRGDIVFSPHCDHFFTLSLNRIYEIEKDGTVTDRGEVEDLTDYGATGTYGALWITKEKYLYAFNNGNGYIYKIRISDHSVVGRYLAESNGNNDGAGCPNQYAPIDSDKDGYYDYQDIDADGDGITNTVENGGVDPYSAGQHSGNYVDTDSDGIPNYLDLDSDNDGIPDNIEAQSTTEFLDASGTVNSNGILPQYGTGLVPVNTDGDSDPDYLDTDSDNDSVNDSDEGVADYYTHVFPMHDEDKDGILNKYDSTQEVYGTPNQGCSSVNDLRTKFVSVPNGELYFRLGLAHNKRPPLANPIAINIFEDFVKKLKDDFKYSDLDSDPFTGVKIYSISAGIMFVDTDDDGTYNTGDVDVNPTPGSPVDITTVADLDKLSFISTDNASSTPNSTIVYKVYDGEVFSVNKYSLHITIFEVNDKPLLPTNVLTITEGATVDITSVFLNSTDTDNTDAELTYTITSLANGNFTKDGVVVTTFTKKDVEDGKIKFVHDGSENAPTYHVKVTDTDGLFSESDAVITFSNANDKPLLPTNVLTITEGATVDITSVFLNSTDTDNTDAELTYTITSLANGNFTKDGVVVTTFTKKDVGDGKIKFVHDGSENAPTYHVKVTDTDGLFSESDVVVSFSLFNNPPVLTVTNAVVEENFTGVVTQATATDVDNLTSELTFSILNYKDGDEFDIDASTGEISYKNSPDYENPSDIDGNNIYVIKVQVSDGTNIVVKEINITVTNDNTISDSNNDKDNDGIPDKDDNCPDTPNPDQVDTDGDGMGDVCDTDDDGDGIPDIVETDNDADGDGKPNSKDSDSDGDGIPDDEEGVDDQDSDGNPNYLDEDSDDDNITDEDEGADDQDGDGKPNYLDEDSDGDGISDEEETDDDLDNDGKPNYLDEDSDGDGRLDRDEGLGDDDGDNIPNYLDNDTDYKIPDGFSADGDDKNSTFIIKGFNNNHRHTIRIFNRWGSLVYKNDNYRNNWDGESNVSLSLGDKLPVGTYFYVLKVKETGRVYKGNVYITR